MGYTHRWHNPRCNRIFTSSNTTACPDRELAFTFFGLVFSIGSHGGIGHPDRTKSPVNSTNRTQRNFWGGIFGIQMETRNPGDMYATHVEFKWRTQHPYLRFSNKYWWGVGLET